MRTPDDGELERQRRVIDLMITSYSVLRDECNRKALLLTLVSLLSSVVLCALTFLPDDAISALHLPLVSTRVLLGVFSSLVLFASIVELRVDWKDRGGRYGDAAERLARAKLLYGTARSAADVSEHYRQAMDNLPRIPDRKFAALKAYHARKVQLSRMIDDLPGCPLRVLRVRLLYRGVRDALRKGSEAKG